MNRLAKSVHPDDVLRRLARGHSAPRGAVVHTGYREPRDAPQFVRLLIVAGLGLVTLIAVAPALLGHTSVKGEGLAPDVALGVDRMASLTVRITGKPISALRKARVTLDGRALPVVMEGDVLLWKPQKSGLTEGVHRLRVQAGSRLLWRGPASLTRRFSFDTTKPTLEVAPSAAYRPDQPVVVSGAVEPGSVVSVGGQATTVVGGRFETAFQTPPIGNLVVIATDAAGNKNTATTRVNVTLPDIRAVHVSSIAWATASLRNPVLKLAEEKKINAVQLDLKDESGRVGHKSNIRLVNQIGASQNLYKLTDAVAELHKRGLRVVGRIVVFRDPLLATVEWKLGGAGRDAVVQGPDGAPYKSTYGKVVFTNPANRNVRDYNLAITREAANAGVDDILFDYIRRPEGHIASLRFPGAKGPVEDEIIAFLDEAALALRNTKTRIGVSVFGIAAKNPEQIAQPVKAMAQTVDYIAPMVYPSHWSKGWYNVADPNAQPYDIVQRSLQDFQNQVKGTGAKVVPWLQDFSLGRDYGAKELREQIQAARDAAIFGYLIWDPKVSYHGDGLPNKN